MAQKSSSTTVAVGSPRLNLVEPEWRTVELAASFHLTGMPAGGGFLLRESTPIRTALLSEAFTLERKSTLFAEASTLHEAMLKIMEQDLLGPHGVTFLFESAELLECLTVLSFPEDDARPIIQCCRNLKRIMDDKIEFRQEPRENLTAAIWLAEHGRICCKPRCQWDNQGPWPPELAELLGLATTF